MRGFFYGIEDLFVNYLFLPFDFLRSLGESDWWMSNVVGWFFFLTRGTKITLFDMYWDKFKNGLKAIDYGKGTIKPNLWGYQAPASKKKKRKG